MKTYTIGTSWKRLLAVSSVLGVLLTGYSASTTANAASQKPTTKTCVTGCMSGGICITCSVPPDESERNAYRRYKNSR